MYDKLTDALCHTCGIDIRKTLDVLYEEKAVLRRSLGLPYKPNNFPHVMDRNLR